MSTAWDNPHADLDSDHDTHRLEFADEAREYSADERDAIYEEDE